MKGENLRERTKKEKTLDTEREEDKKRNSPEKIEKMKKENQKGVLW